MLRALSLTRFANLWASRKQGLSTSSRNPAPLSPSPSLSLANLTKAGVGFLVGKMDPDWVTDAVEEEETACGSSGLEFALERPPFLHDFFLGRGASFSCLIQLSPSFGGSSGFSNLAAALAAAASASSPVVFPAGACLRRGVHNDKARTHNRREVARLRPRETPRGSDDIGIVLEKERGPYPGR